MTNKSERETRASATRTDRVGVHIIVVAFVLVVASIVGVTVVAIVIAVCALVSMLVERL
jgi:hypothetical protein